MQALPTGLSGIVLDSASDFDLLDLEGLSMRENDEAEVGWELVRKYECLRTSVAELLQDGFQVSVVYIREIPLAPTFEPNTWGNNTKLIFSN